LWLDSRADNPSPILHLRTIWREAELRTSLFLVMAVGAILGCGLFVLPQYLRYVQDHSATQTGEFIVMYTGGLGAGLLLTLRVIQPRLGGPRTAALGLLLLIGTFTNLPLYVDAHDARESAGADDLPAGLRSGSHCDCGGEYCDRASGSPGSQRRVDHILLLCDNWATPLGLRQRRSCSITE
jgi:hypothetical protein